MTPMSSDELREEGFEVVEPMELDLSDVKEERVLLPPTNNVRLRIRKVTNTGNQDNTYRQLNVSFQVEDGIQVGEETKFKGSVLFERVCYYADPMVYTKDFFKRKQHLVQLQQLMKAMGEDISKLKISDDFLASLTDKVVIGDIRQRANNFIAKDGTEVSTAINTVSRFRAVPEGSEV